MQNYAGGLALDIDDTLSETAHTCMNRLVEAYGKPQQKSVRVLLKEYGQPNKVPFWQNEDSMGFVQRNLNDPDFLRGLPVIKGAVSTITKIDKIMPIRCYITSRPKALEKVTQLWLRSNGFPEAPVVGRNPSEFRVGWKGAYLEKHYPDLFGFVDDDINNLSKKGPLWYQIWLNRHDTERPRNKNVVMVRRWTELEQWVQNQNAAKGSIKQEDGRDITQEQGRVQRPRFFLGER